MGCSADQQWPPAALWAFSGSLQGHSHFIITILNITKHLWVDLPNVVWIIEWFTIKNVHCSSAIGIATCWVDLHVFNMVLKQQRPLVLSYKIVCIKMYFLWGCFCVVLWQWQSLSFTKFKLFLLKTNHTLWSFFPFSLRAIGNG